ncbi:hypothetical protein [Ruegeria hyattellae]|uniref:hypothetical protein n=1 Tax=Ruegeria hyattellae TaxID=3233337 RepID=UPI00355BB170
MSDTILIVAGLGGAIIALVHGYLGQTIVIPSFSGGSPSMRRVNHAVFQLSTLYWFAGGIALIYAAVFIDQGERTIIVAMVSFLYITGAVGNLWATRGRHPGWILLTVVTGLAIIGA